MLEQTIKEVFIHIFHLLKHCVLLLLPLSVILQHGIQHHLKPFVNLLGSAIFLGIVGHTVSRRNEDHGRGTFERRETAVVASTTDNWQGLVFAIAVSYTHLTLPTILRV